MTGFMYTDAKEGQILLWALEYLMPQIFETFERIPENRIYTQPAPVFNCAAWEFAHMAVIERTHVGYFAQGIDDVPQQLRIFLPGCRPDEAQIREAVRSKRDLTSYYRHVRSETGKYLDNLPDTALKTVPGIAPPPHEQDPIREFFIMTIQHQYYHWGRLRAFQDLLESN